MLWMVEGHRAAVEWKPATGRFVAAVPALPGIWAEGARRRQALARLAERHAARAPAARPASRSRFGPGR